MLKIASLFILVALTLTLNYPLFKQCDAKWASERLGTSPNTICSAGCLMSSAAMALNTAGNNQINPSPLNKWLTENSGYVQGDLFVWASIERWGVTFKGFISNGQIKDYIDAGFVVILNVNNGGHWVLATGYNGDSINVNDPGYSVSSYSLSEVVNGNTGVYTINKLPNFVNNFLISISEFIKSITGEQKKVVIPPVPTLHQLNNIRQQ